MPEVIPIRAKEKGFEKQVYSLLFVCWADRIQLP